MFIEQCVPPIYIYVLRCQTLTYSKASNDIFFFNGKQNNFKFMKTTHQTVPNLSSTILAKTLLWSCTIYTQIRLIHTHQISCLIISIYHQLIHQLMLATIWFWIHSQFDMWICMWEFALDWLHWFKIWHHFVHFGNISHAARGNEFEESG